MIHNNKSISYKNIMFFLYAFLIITSFINSAMAGSTTVPEGSDVIGQSLCNVVHNLTQGGIAKAVATIAIFAIGIGLFLGRANWGVALSTVAGVGIIFSATLIIQWITGDTSISACGYKTTTAP